MKKSLLILAVSVVIIFSNSLFNGFVGDDGFLIEQNTFFETWSNVRFLFSPVYTIDPDAAFNLDNFNSGSVAYRPVLSLTYFLDHALWGKTPFGYHLQNVIWHALNVCLLFLVFSFSGLRSVQRVSFWAALLFAVHPLTVEAVCSIGYRADVLSSFFVLSGFLCYLLSKRGGAKGKQWMAGTASVVLFGAGVFAKESAIVFPALIVLYEMILEPGLAQLNRVVWSGLMAGYAAAAGFYLFVYVVLFPNPALGQVSWMGGNGWAHLYYIAAVLGYYLKGAVFPWTVRTLPPVFYFDFASVLERWDVFWTIAAAAAGVWFWRVRRQEERGILFGAGWFVLAYLPVSGLIPMVTPVAHRYIYLPLAGLSLILAWALTAFNEWFLKRRLLRGNFIPAALCVFCAVTTASLNTAWKNNYVLARHMTDDFPDNPRGYFFTGLFLADHSDRPEALKYLSRAAELGMDDPRLFLKMGETLAFLERKEESREWYRKGIAQFPQIYQNYAALGGSFVASREPEQAVEYLEASLSLKPMYAAAGYLIQAYRMLGQEDAARDVYDTMVPLLTRESETASLRALLEEDAESFPICLGQ